MTLETINESWADCLDEKMMSEDENDAGWQVVPMKKVVAEKPPMKTARWCRDGNACQWSNCTYRHEECTHHTQWLARDKRGYSCRSIKSDPHSCKSPDNGGCQYDHRDKARLRVRAEVLPVNTESELWDSFFERGLEPANGSSFDVSGLTGESIRLLIKSLDAAGVKYEDNGKSFRIDFTVENPEWVAPEGWTPESLNTYADGQESCWVWVPRETE